MCAWSSFIFLQMNLAGGKSSLSFILFCGFSAGLPHMVMLRFGQTFIDESLIIAPPFVILIRTGSHWRFVSG